MSARLCAVATCGRPAGKNKADHLDGDKTNNAPANLVPSCPSCNAARGNCGNPVDWRVA